MFNPKDREDNTKISYLIQQNFSSPTPSTLGGFQTLQEFCTLGNLDKNKSQLMAEGMGMKDFEKLVKEKKQAIMKKYL